MDEKDFWMRLMAASGTIALLLAGGLVMGLAYYILTR